MRDLGELSLLAAFVGSGFAAFACLAGAARGHRRLWAAGIVAAWASLLSLTAVMGILAWALVARDFGFAYVAQYSSTLLPWHYSLSALWGGQAGSLLLWAWFSAVLALLFWSVTRRRTFGLGGPALGVQLGYLCFLIAIMVFAADPMQAGVATARDGAGLSPLLQHPAMLIHPPIVFLGYALWTIPFALAAAALVTGRLDAEWVRQARPWALAAWGVLGLGILWGADWAYEELGWGGYWGWDPVENGSLIPWLTGTALLHVLMVWQYRDAFKRTTLALAFATFGLCNFATFLTRSGVFSSLHAFSASPIGWLFLALMVGLTAGGVFLLLYRRAAVRSEKPIPSVLSREALVLIGVLALLLLTGVVIAGTLSGAVSSLIAGRTVMVGPAFYNYVLIPIGLVLLATTAMAPLVRWGAVPTDPQRRWLRWSGAIGLVALLAAMACGVRSPLALLIAGLATLTPLTLLAAVVIDARRQEPNGSWRGVLRTLGAARRQYAGFLMHVGFAALAIGVTGSSLGTQQRDVDLNVGDVIAWAGYDLRLAGVRQRQLPDKLVGEAELELRRDGQTVGTLVPAQHLHLRQQEWTSEVAIHSTWAGDVYVILRSGDDNTVSLTLVENPLMRWLWLSGWVIGVGMLVWMFPRRRRKKSAVLLPLRSPPLPAAATTRAA